MKCGVVNRIGPSGTFDNCLENNGEMLSARHTPAAFLGIFGEGRGVLKLRIDFAVFSVKSMRNEVSFPLPSSWLSFWQRSPRSTDP